MAEEDDVENNEENSGEEKVSGGKKKFILLAVLFLVVVAISVTGTYFAVKLLGPQPVEELVEETEEDVVELPKQAIYYPIKPAVIVTFDVKGRRRYLQADVSLMTRDDDVVAALETHLPMIRNALTLIIGGQRYEEIKTAEGKELLRLACLEEIRRLMEIEISKPGVEQVLFTNLVMQ